MNTKTILYDRMKEINKPWTPIEVARVNDQVVRMALFHGEYHWHKHTNEDELFYVIKGAIIIQLLEQPNVILNEGEMVVIPKGIKHSPKSLNPSYVLMFEPSALQRSGD